MAALLCGSGWQHQARVEQDALAAPLPLGSGDHCWLIWMGMGAGFDGNGSSHLAVQLLTLHREQFAGQGLYFNSHISGGKLISAFAESPELNNAERIFSH